MNFKPYYNQFSPECPGIFPLPLVSNIHDISLYAGKIAYHKRVDKFLQEYGIIEIDNQLTRNAHVRDRRFQEPHPQILPDQQLV
jgi:hypothetical protein